ncbi:MAG: DNA-directed RNA polymerase subunit omega [Clostridiales bacterium]|jgi:DNA-directed RNA polymerase subunit omega|nr:DNA-directed RNA polymerase subunit omega [Clostridiales bacterium]
MSRPSVDDMLCGRQSRYSLVIAVAKRAREISSQAESSGEILLEKPVNMAIRDFVNHKYAINEPDRDD